MQIEIRPISAPPCEIILTMTEAEAKRLRHVLTRETCDDGTPGVPYRTFIAQPIVKDLVSKLEILPR